MPRKITKKQAKKRADTAMSQYIRQKYADPHGMVECVTCGIVNRWQTMHAAHFIGRGSEATRFVEENVHPACPGCNVYHKERHMRRYTLFMIDIYGREKIDELEALSREICRRRLADYLEIEADYQQRLESLLARRKKDSGPCTQLRLIDGK